MQVKVGSEIPQYFGRFTPYMDYKFLYVVKSLYKQPESQLKSILYKITDYYQNEPSYLFGNATFFRVNCSSEEDLDFFAAYAV